MNRRSPSPTEQAVRGNVVDLLAGRIWPGELVIVDGRIAARRPLAGRCATWLLPGFIDAHVHVESSMLTPPEFARAAVVHGTVATVSDPHEIANVLGEQGVQYMLQCAAGVPLKFYFGAPSCVPATQFETAGAALDHAAVARLLDDPRIHYLSEMMNVPGVLAGDPEVLAKITAARERGKPVDGHAPGLRGAQAAAYLAAGISTDHECLSADEAREKIAHGARILIRQGSAARNFEALCCLVDEYPEACMFCSDDKHPDELLEGHINLLLRQGVARGFNLMHLLRVACLNPVRHYGLDVGLLREGDPADFIEVDSLTEFRVLRTFLAGQLAAEDGQACFAAPPCPTRNRFAARLLKAVDFRVPADSQRIRVIQAVDGELVTRASVEQASILAGAAAPDTARDLLKLAVVNRYHDTAPAVAFIRGFGLKHGALASSVAHDCHNIVAVGSNDEDLCQAVNLVIQQQGGLAVAAGPTGDVLPLPVAGLMSTGPCPEVARHYARLDGLARQLGCTLRAPFMTLSFMALLVIPELKLSDRGLFDGRDFALVPLFV